MWFVIAVFFLSLAGIAGLFFVKQWELQRGARVLAPEVRAKADDFAVRLKQTLIALQADLAKLPPELLHLSRVLLHDIVLGTAATLRFLERKAHELADLVSHKHHFERRAPRSEFLKKVSESRNGSGDTDPSQPL